MRQLKSWTARNDSHSYKFSVPFYNQKRIVLVAELYYDVNMGYGIKYVQTFCRLNYIFKVNNELTTVLCSLPKK